MVGFTAKARPKEDSYSVLVCDESVGMRPKLV